MIRRVFLAGTVAASSRRVHVVLKVDVEPGEYDGPRGAAWMIRATGEESSPAAMIVEVYVKDGAAHWDAMTMGASYACGTVDDFEREHPWLRDVRWYPCDRNGDVVARSPA